MPDRAKAMSALGGSKTDVAALRWDACLAPVSGHVRKVPARGIPREPKALPRAAQRVSEAVFEFRWQRRPARKAAPSATSAIPGQFDLIPKPAAGLVGSRVSLGRSGRSRLLPLERDENRFSHNRRWRSNLRTRWMRRCRGSDRSHCRRPRLFALQPCAANV